MKPLGLQWESGEEGTVTPAILASTLRVNFQLGHGQPRDVPSGSVVWVQVQCDTQTHGDHQGLLSHWWTEEASLGRTGGPVHTAFLLSVSGTLSVTGKW